MEYLATIAAFAVQRGSKLKHQVATLVDELAFQPRNKNQTKIKSQVYEIEVSNHIISF